MPTSRLAGLDRLAGNLPRPDGGSRTLGSRHSTGPERPPPPRALGAGTTGGQGCGPPSRHTRPSVTCSSKDSTINDMAETIASGKRFHFRARVR
jgi:hypothetical protein